jgi:hypothetical protein
MLGGIWKVEEWMDRCMLSENKKEAMRLTGTEYLTIEEGDPLKKHIDLRPRQPRGVWRVGREGGQVVTRWIQTRSSSKRRRRRW